MCQIQYRSEIGKLFLFLLCMSDYVFMSYLRSSFAQLLVLLIVMGRYRFMILCKRIEVENQPPNVDSLIPIPQPKIASSAVGSNAAIAIYLLM